MENEKTLLSIDGQELVDESSLSQVTGAGMATNAVTWAVGSSSVNVIIADYKDKNVGKAAAIGAFAGAASSLTFDTALKLMKK
jgi:hypothetical protein